MLKAKICTEGGKPMPRLFSRIFLIALITGIFSTSIPSFAQTARSAPRRDSGVIKETLGLPGDLQATVNACLQRNDRRQQARITTQQSVKIGVRKDGMYRVTRAELETTQFNVNSDSTNWRLFTGGIEQAIIVGAGDQYVEFYGKGLDVRETDTRPYYLVADSVPGKRMISKILNNIGSNVVSNNYRFSVEKKERVNYASSVINGDIENYFGRPVFSDLPQCNNPLMPCTYIDLSGVDMAGMPATITVKLQGLPYTQSSVQHNIRVLLNGVHLGVVVGNGAENFSGELNIPAGVLIEGRNILRLATSASNDAVYFDSVKISYSRKYQADNNKVLFYTSGYRKVDVNGFNSDDIRVFDITLDGNPQIISNLPVTQNGATFSVRMPSHRPAVMYALTHAALLQVDSIVPNAPSSLASPNNAADMIIVSHSAPDFIAAAETWANYRRSVTGGDFIVKVVDVADIFDEFSYGVHTAAAVRSFLQYAKTNWQNPDLRYVLLIGDASTDPRNYEGYGNNDLVSTRVVNSVSEEIGSDEALADLNNDGLADFAVGRIPVRTVAEVTTVFNKTTAFEVPELQSLERGFLCASDHASTFDFPAMCQMLKDQLPPNTPNLLVNRGDPNAHETLIDGINTGKILVNFSGHTALGVWGSSTFFATNDVPFLTNASRPSIFTVLDGYNGLFTYPRVDSLTEALVKHPGGGGAAAWASLTETTPDYQLALGTRFTNQIGLGNIKRIGDLVADAQSTIAGSDVGYSWVLLGDPALKVRP